ncbi:hypothetical protein EHW63_01385 [Salinivibrio sp. VYel9]|nr:hypothetical protein [Salinivibrio sp. VYel7]MPX92413.1 hypothetical protein [Salinivibrio sp. VYel9]MPX97677.1 hypothetical protein [Salinivibrio sp. VYel6]MPX98645.1 hypothetical protein [Salinivibrio sp. VYel4]MPY01654.1 hypothetical protein [Salinivibrio sp. VYel5]MPY04570.1 hypothetical protein [Salinivibrio sp. VYel8]MPY13163.1 hypothetical protein [Salinivibrio sp. VGrn1]
MNCSCCSKALNSGMIYKKDAATGRKYKSCPHCSDANGGEHVFHPYPSNFGKTPARKTAQNPTGHQSYCIDCRRLNKGVASTVHQNGRLCRSLV